MFYKLPSTPLYFLMLFTFRSFYLAALLDDTEDDPLKMDILDKADLLSEFDEEFSKKRATNTSNSKTWSRTEDRWVNGSGNVLFESFVTFY